MFDYYDTLITAEEAAELLGCGMNMIYKILKSGNGLENSAGASLSELYLSRR